MDQGKIRERLLQERQLLEEQIKRMEDWGLGEQQSWLMGELSSYDQHPADLGSEVYERGKDIALRNRAKTRLQEIDEALAKLDSGEYHICSRCGQQIDEERLEAMPSAVLCIECKKKEEDQFSDSKMRPPEEYVMRPSYAFRDDWNEYVGFDGEDAWQAVAQYGTSNSPQDIPGSVAADDAYIDADEDIGNVDALEKLVDIRGDGVSDLEAVYPDPQSHSDQEAHR